MSKFLKPLLLFLLIVTKLSVLNVNLEIGWKILGGKKRQGQG